MLKIQSVECKPEDPDEMARHLESSALLFCVHKNLALKGIILSDSGHLQSIPYRRNSKKKKRKHTAKPVHVYSSCRWLGGFYSNRLLSHNLRACLSISKLG